MIRLAKRLGAHHVTNANSQMQTRDLLGGKTCLQQLQTVPDPIAICGALVAHLWRCINCGDTTWEAYLPTSPQFA